MPPMLTTLLHEESSKAAVFQAFGAVVAPFQEVSLIMSAGASTPGAWGMILATMTWPKVCWRTRALLAKPVTPRPRTAWIAMVFAPGSRYFATGVMKTCMPSGDEVSLSTDSASLPLSHTFTLRGPAM